MLCVTMIHTSSSQVRPLPLRTKYAGRDSAGYICARTDIEEPPTFTSQQFMCPAAGFAELNDLHTGIGWVSVGLVISYPLFFRF